MGCQVSIPQTEEGIPVSIKALPDDVKSPARASPKNDPPTAPQPIEPEVKAKPDSMNFIDNLDSYGTYKFKGAVRPSPQTAPSAGVLKF